MTAIQNRVGTYRAVGLEARWSRDSDGAPFIAVRNPASPNKHQSVTWWMVDDSMFKAMKKLGIIEGFNSATLLGNYFSISVN